MQKNSMRMRSGQLTAKMLAGFLKFKAKKPRPLFASYNVTGRCNMKCSFCEWWKKGYPELSTRKALDAIANVCGLGVSFFDLSGGEPLLRPDLSKLAKKAASCGSLVSMNTNGTLLKKGRALEIAQVFDVVVVSLDGPKEIHDKFRGVSGTYEKATRAIRLLKSRGVRVGVNSVVTPENVGVLPDFIRELHGFVDFVQVQPVHPYPPPPPSRPPPQAVSILTEYLLELKHDDPSFLAVPADFVRGIEPFFKGNIPKICHAGELYVAIDPMGNLLACPARSDITLGKVSMDSAGNLLRERLSNEAWNKIYSCEGCWLECTVGVSMILQNPLKEAANLVRLWASRGRKT